MAHAPTPGDSFQTVATLGFPPCGRDLLKGNDRSAEGVYLLWPPSLATIYPLYYQQLSADLPTVQ